MTEITPEIYKKLGVDLFNKVWSLIDKSYRTEEEDDLMINAAHASYYHWLQVGEPVNRSRGEWQISRVYSICGRPEPAFYHAKKNLRICLENAIGDFDLAFAYEALARAHKINKDESLSDKYYKLGLDSAAQIKKKDDRKYFLQELESIKKL